MMNSTAVGEDRFEPAPDLDAHPALGWRDDEKHAIVQLLVPMPQWRPS